MLNRTISYLNFVDVQRGKFFLNEIVRMLTQNLKNTR